MTSNQGEKAILADDGSMETLLAELVDAGWMTCGDPSEIAEMALNTLRRAAEREQWSHAEWIRVMWAAGFGALR